MNHPTPSIDAQRAIARNALDNMAATLPRGIELTPRIVNAHDNLERAKVALTQAQTISETAHFKYVAAADAFARTPSAMNWRTLEHAMTGHQDTWHAVVTIRAEMNRRAHDLLSAVTATRIGGAS